MSSNPNQPPGSFAAGWLLRSLENASNLETITRLMQDYFKLTGTWPDPKQASERVISTKPTVRVVDPWESPEQDFQPPLPGIAKPVAVPEGVGGQRQSKYQITGYAYGKDSPYRREACRRLLTKIPAGKLSVAATSIEALLEAGELAQVEQEMSLHLPMGCLNLYTLVIAWSHLSVFVDGTGRTLGYMTLSLKRMARELGVKSDTVYSWIGFLQHYQLLEVGNLQTGIIQPNEYELLKSRIQNLSCSSEVGNLFTGREIQRKSTFYRVKPKVSLLPVFEPGTRGANSRGTRDIEPGDILGTGGGHVTTTGGTLERVQVAPIELGDTSHVSPTCSPGLHDYELIHDDKAAKNIIVQEKANKNAYPSRFEAELQLLTPEQRESFELLSNIHERIPGYSSRGMDGGEAVKLACCHSKAKIIEITDFFFTRLAQGKEVDYPIAYLHSLITRGIQPLPLPDQEERTAQRQRAAQYQREPSGRKRKPTEGFTYQPNTTPETVVEYDLEATDPLDPPVITEPINPVVDFKLKRRLKQVDRRAEWLYRLAVDGSTLNAKFVGQTPDFNRTAWLSVVQQIYPQVTEIIVL